MYNVVYLDINDLRKLVVEKPTGFYVGEKRFYTLHDVSVIMSEGECAAIFCQDKKFIETLKQVVVSPAIIENMFTPVCRCYIINLENIKDGITLSELGARYGNKL
ncbi:MAG: hypothetical protein RR444_07025 [Oscillospiraceae bacterium]